MSILTNTIGLLKKKSHISVCLADKVTPLIHPWQVSKGDKIIGWGNKPHAKRVKSFAVKRGIPYLHLEDAFISYLGHPAKGGINIGIVVDEQGIYYDANTPSDIEKYISAPLSEQQLHRSNQLIQQIASKGVTKYNTYSNQYLPEDINQSLAQAEDKTKILVVDQIAGDLSIPGSLASEQSFYDMIKAASDNHPNAQVYLRTHPDTKMGRKRGVLDQASLEDVIILDQPCHPHALIEEVDAVYTVSSQMGFEALLLGKPVYCFGMPFYAGWGLTQDAISIERRGTASLQQLVYAAFIKYSRYYNPITERACEVEEIIQLIHLQQRVTRYSRAYLVNFSLWKKAFLKHFAKSIADEIKFVSTPPKRVADDEVVLVWGARYPELEQAIRVEDGFIRSAGLGANLCKPSSLSFDYSGMYFDSRRESDLERRLSYESLTEQQKQRGRALIERLQATGVSKYNVGVDAAFTPSCTEKRVILIVGQVDGDASIKTGSPIIQSNEQLLYAVREAAPDAHIIFKPHPDVVSGNRAGQVSQQCLASCVNQTVTELPLTSLYPHIDELHTMTSLSGFEALVQGVEVHTWGQPFYSGWGLTEDKHPVDRRTRNRQLEELVYLTLVAYPSYVDWKTKLWSAPEWVIEDIHQAANTGFHKDSYLARLWIKAKYLVETLFT